MDLRQLEYFLAIADARSFSRAADTIRVSQSALSRQISLLEEELGTALFDRHGRGVELTEAGDLLRRKANAILAQVSDVRNDILARADEPVGEAILAIPPSLRNPLSVRIAQRFRDECPKVYLRIVEGTTLQSRDRVARGDADVGLMSTVEPTGDLSCTPLITDALALIGPADSGLRWDRPVPLETLADLPLLVTPRSNSLRQIVDNALHDKGLMAQPVMETWTIGLMVELIRTGIGYSVMPYSAIWDNVAEGVVAAGPIENLTISWLIATGRGRPLSAAARRLVAMIQEEAAELVESGKWHTAKLPT